MNLLEVFFLFIFGLVLGSFLNVLILRYKPGEAVFGKHLKGRSSCVHCGKILSFKELIPVISFIIQSGRCRGCKKNITAQYPIVEILSGIVFATVPYILGFTPYAFLWALALLVLIAASFIDIRHYVIPDSLNLIIAAIGVASMVLIGTEAVVSDTLIPGTFLGHYASVFSFTENVWIGRFAAAIAGGAFFSLIIITSRGKAMGWGDAKLAAATGILMGWPDIIAALMISFIVGGVFGIITMITKRKKSKDILPFGPFIAFGIIMIFYFGQDIMALYFRFLGLGVL